MQRKVAIPPACQVHWHRQMPSVAIVMNMFYTGIGIARSLGERGVRVIGLSAHPGTYGNCTRYAQVQLCPDSREEPEALLQFLLRLGEHISNPAAIFPTRDDDMVFLQRFRKQLSGRYALLLPQSSALQGCLNKWETYEWAQAAGIPAPRSWNVGNEEDVRRIASEVSFPCVLKPISAHLWRRAGNWEKVGRRKAIAISCRDELFSVYNDVARSESRLLLQELVSGGDDCLYVAACYLDRQSNFIGGFTAHKLLQVPKELGTGCIVQAIDRPNLLVMARKLLQKMRFTGIAEVEFKWDHSCREYKLIEINPRPWDQHRLGKACGVDLIYTAYCDLMGLPVPPLGPQKTGPKWIAEDVFTLVFLKSLSKRNGEVGSLLRLARGERTYAVWSARDPLPFLALIARQLGPELVRSFLRRVSSFIRPPSVEKIASQKGLSRENSLAKAKCKT